jgi:hypothetical protein
MIKWERKMFDTEFVSKNENGRTEVSIIDTFVWLTIKKAIKTFTWPKSFEQKLSFELKWDTGHQLRDALD